MIFVWIISPVLTRRVIEIIRLLSFIHQNIDVAGKHIILVDDAIESGGTMKRIVEHMTTGLGAQSVSIATLFVKPGRVDIPVKQYFAYEMENDDLLVGYGLPWQDKYRNIPFISKLKR